MTTEEKNEKMLAMQTGVSIDDRCLPPFNPDNLDDRIRGLVMKLRQLGYPTFTSCQSGLGHSFKKPTVGILYPHSKCNTLRKELKKLGLVKFSIAKKKSWNSVWVAVYASTTNGEYLWVQGFDLLDYVG